MALRTLMLRRRIDKKKEELVALRGKDLNFETRERDLERAIEEADTDEEEEAVEEEIEGFEEEKKNHEEARTKLEAEIEELETELREAEEMPPQEERQTRKEERTARRGGRTMMTRAEIRKLPMNVRVFDTMPMEMRKQMIESEDVKGFLTELRGMKGTGRAIKGGDLEIPVVFVELIAENVYRYSKLINRVRVRPVKGETRQTIAGTIPEAVWTEMCGAINELTFVFNQTTLDGFKVAGFIPVCNSFLEDTTDNLNLASWIIEMISEAIGLAKDKAILYGKGAASKMPTGIVTRLSQTTKPVDYPADAPEWENLSGTNIVKIDPTGKTGAQFWAELMMATGNTYTRYSRGELFWAMNSRTLTKLKSKLITFTASGDVAANIFGTLPIITGDVDILEFIPDGDIIGGYGDLYLWIERGTMAIESSEHVQFIRDNTVFRGKERADGAPVVPGAFVAINIDNKEVTTVMDFAADTANDADLMGLTVGTETLSPAFDSKVMSYSIASAAEASAEVRAVSAQPKAIVTVEYNGKNVGNGGTVTFVADGKAHDIVVTVENGNARKVYSVAVTKTTLKRTESAKKKDE